MSLSKKTKNEMAKPCETTIMVVKQVARMYKTKVNDKGDIQVVGQN